MLDLYASSSDWATRTRRRMQPVVRILNHYISVRGIAIRAVEALLLLAAFVAVNTTVPLERLAGAGTAAVFVLMALFSLQTFGMYQRHRNQLFDTLGRLAVVYVCAGMASLALIRLLPVTPLAHMGLPMTLGVAFGLSLLLRLTVPHVSRHVLPAVNVLVVGNDELAREVASVLDATDPLEGVAFAGIYDPRQGRFARPASAIAADPHDGADPTAALTDVIERESVGEVVIASADQRGLPLADLLRFKMAGVKVTDYVTFLEREKRYLAIDAMRPSWLLYSQGFDHGPARIIAKRLFDIAVSAALLLLLGPILLLAMLAVRLEGGSVFFRQPRVGAEGREIEILKLRSMIQNAEQDGVPQWATKNDARVTRIGKFIRLTRIDEIPQLISVLKGDMSFVGPRPERRFFVDQLRQQIPYYDLRHTIKPGLTGWAQVSYPYGASVEDARAKLRYDLYYIKNHSLLLDVVILLNTIRIVLFGTGAR